MSDLKRFGYGAVGLIIGLGSAVAAYQAAGLLGVAVSDATELGDLHVAWFPFRAFAAISAARFSASWMPRLRKK
jgi:hypothetical protein